MRHVFKDFEAIPPALKGLEITVSLLEILGGNKKSISSNLYRGRMETEKAEIKFLVVEQLKKLYRNKCAYCESKEYDPNMEHYRPLKRVILVRGHKGYFWLCYEWSNLLPSCQPCNKAGGGKGNQFPILIEAARQFDPPLNEAGQLDFSRCRANDSPLLDEQPYLLHPEIDHPEDFFKFTSKGKMIGTDSLGRGQETIKICNLNRKPLRRNRQKIVDLFKGQIRTTTFLYLKKELTPGGFENEIKDLFRRMEALQKPQKEFSLFGKYIFENFSQIFLPLFDPIVRPHVKQAWVLYQSNSN